MRPRDCGRARLYWPGATHDYFTAVGTTLETELRRYDAVIFFETAAVGGASIEGGNPTRNESLEEAVELDGRLRRLWARRPRFVLVPNDRSFFKKISLGLAALAGIVAQIGCDARCAPPQVTRKRSGKGGA